MSGPRRRLGGVAADAGSHLPISRVGVSMSPSAEQIVLESAKSSVLRAEFDRLRWATGSDHEPKFPRGVCDKLATLITTRNYASAVLQLCHLVGVARRLLGADGYLFFFMQVDSARHECFRRQLIELIESTPPGGGAEDALRDIELRRNGVGIRYPDGRFLVYFSQMPLLCGLLELLINSLELDAVDAIFDEMCGGEITGARVSRGANRLSALLYEFLKRNLPTVHEQRKHRHLIAFMEKRCGSRFGAEEIDDDAVLDLWYDEAGNGNPFGTDFKLFKTVTKAFILLRETLIRGRQLYAMDRPTPLGQDWEGGEIDPGAYRSDPFELEGETAEPEPSPAHLRPWVIEGIVEQIDADACPLDRLAEPPLSRVKFLNQRERKDLSAIVEAGEHASALPLSILRAEVFDPLQRRIGRNAEKRRGCVADEEPDRSYAERRERYDTLHEHLSRVTAATAHAIAITGSPRDAEEGNANRPVADLALWRKAQAEFTRLNRAGFDTAALADPEVEEAFRSATTPLLTIFGRLSRFRETLAGIPDWDGTWQRDKQRFAAKFERLYGEKE